MTTEKEQVTRTQRSQLLLADRLDRYAAYFEHARLLSMSAETLDLAVLVKDCREAAAIIRDEWEY